MKCCYKFAALVCLSLLGCGEVLPDAPPPMDLEQEKAIVEKNIKLESDYIMSNPNLTPEQKKDQIEQVKRAGAGHLKAFAESKAARDEHYGETP